jgi:hypothetical protein
MKVRVKNPVIIIAWLQFAGCTLIDSTLSIDYQPLSKPAFGVETPVFLSRVEDVRPERTRIGCKKNGYGSESADLLLDVPLEMWFAGMLNQEMRSAGLKLASASQAGAVLLEVKIEHFFIEPDVSFGTVEIYAAVVAEVKVFFPDGKAFSRRFAAYEHASSVLPTDASYTEPMRLAVESWVRQALPALQSLLARQTDQRQACGWTMVRS